jgi:hypothetical protein
MYWVWFQDLIFDLNLSLSLFISDIREGAIACLIANLMEQLMIDNTADIYHQARKIAYSCPVFQTEVWYEMFSIKFFISLILGWI